MVNVQSYLQQYQSQEAEVRMVIDVLAVYMYPLERYTFIDTVQRIKEIPQNRVIEILEILTERGLGSYNLAGNYSLVPELSFLLFPEKIRQPEYLRLLDFTKPYSFYSTSARLQELQQVLTAFFTGDRSLLLQPVRKICFELPEYLPYLCYLLYYPAYEGFLKLFDEESIIRICNTAVQQHLQAMTSLNMLEEFRQKMVSFLHMEAGTLADAEVTLQRGAISAAMTGKDELYARAVVQLYEGQPATAFTLFEQGIKLQRQHDKKNSIPTSPLFAFFYAYTLTALPEERSFSLIPKITTAYEKKLFPAITPAISLLHFHNGRKEKAEHQLQILLENSYKQNDRHLLSYLALICLQLFYPKSKLLKTYAPLAAMLLQRGIQHQYNLLTYEYLSLFQDDNHREKFRELGHVFGKPPIVTGIQPLPEWERLLNTLLLSEKTQKEKPAMAFRLCYLIDPDNYTVQPILQTLHGDTGWSRGRAVELKRLREGLPEGMTDQDKRIAATILKENHHIYRTETYVFGEKVWHEITGHPYLFLASDPEVSIEVSAGVPELIVNKTGKGYTFSTNLNDYSGNTLLVKASNTRLKIVHLTPQQRNLLQTLKQIGSVPEEGKDKLLQALKQIGAHITVHANLEDTALNIKQYAADTRIRVQLHTSGDTLRAGFSVKPFVNEPPYCRPGEGAKHIIGVMNGERCQATRDLEAERRHFTQLITLIQETLPQEIQDDSIAFDDPLDCLQLLEIIQRHPELAIAEWPEGEKLRLRKPVYTPQLRMTVKADGRWFALNGELRIDETTVLSLKELLDATKISQRRFVTLQNGDFLALTGKLYRQLAELSAVVMETQDRINISPLTSHMLRDLLAEAGHVDTDAAWQRLLKQQETAANIFPEVPNTLQTTLRPYQEDGFRWMIRLAALGAGACLADDMGLGKTVQSIAVLLYRAALGPALVVCPASVLPNWSNELTRFAPSLRILSFTNGDRHSLLQSAGAFDIVLSTYGLLQSETKLMAGIRWNTVVLDEAHTIKNYQTKTSKAAMALEADFRLILTGTPIQNHLAEIWNLFNFINPGLLGTLQHFNKQFATPVIYNAESTVTRHLRKIITPFLLRRTKTTVLDELPEKTEIVKMVSLSSEEASFYEALRLKAIENIKEYGLGKNKGKQHLNTLTEIGKLRMAACNTQMIDPEINIPSSKQSVFMEITEELIENNHRALVFSQYVRHLELVKRGLDEKGISYLYLDGSTPIPIRESLVKRFQSGEASLFLISLKAGGLGLNLTAADYVIHLDPWWNPAIEEQASDRAYRIGQTRPVTIYRLVAKHTIEEKIIALHNSKRDLADRLLEGSDSSGKLSTEELLALIADEAI